MDFKKLNESLLRAMGESQTNTITFGLYGEYRHPQMAYSKNKKLVTDMCWAYRTFNIIPGKSLLLVANDEGFASDLNSNTIEGTTLQEIEANWVKQWKEDPEVGYDCFDTDTGLIMETDREFENAEEFVSYAERYYTESYIDGDSGSVHVLFDPHHNKILLQGRIEIEHLKSGKKNIQPEEWRCIANIKGKEYVESLLKGERIAIFLNCDEPTADTLISPIMPYRDNEKLVDWLKDYIKQKDGVDIDKLEADVESGKVTEDQLRKQGYDFGNWGLPIYIDH